MNKYSYERTQKIHKIIDPVKTVNSHSYTFRL